MPDAEESRGAPDACRVDPKEGGHRCRTLIDSIDQGFCLIEQDGGVDPGGDFRFLAINAAFDRHTGLRGVVGRTLREALPGLDERWLQAFARVVRTGEPLHVLEQSRALGDRWFDVHAFRMDEPGFGRVGVLFADVSERVRGEKHARLLGELTGELLRTSNERSLPAAVGGRIAAHLRASQCSFVEIDWERRVGIVNECWCEPGLPSTAGVHPLYEFLHEQFWMEARAGTVLIVADTEHDRRIVDVDRFRALQIRSFLAVPLLRDGEWRCLFSLARTTPSVWRPDQVDFARDAASRCWERVERLRAEGALRASEERLRLIVESVREYAIFTLDLERRVTTWNAGAERLLGFTEREIVGQMGDMLFTAGDRLGHAPQGEAEEALRHGRATNERWHVRKDGSVFWGSGVTTAMRDANGVLCGLVKILRDETDARASRQALERSEEELRAALRANEEARAQAEQARRDAEAAGQAKDNFLAALSHELRTPLNPVLMIASEAAADASVPAELRADFAAICKNVELEARLIDDMLDMTRIAHGKLSLRKVRVDVHQVVREALEMVRAAATEKDVSVSLHLEAVRSRIIGDPARLEQIFTNLLTNSIKFTTPRGWVALRTCNPDGREEIEVRVSDNGIGLTQDELGRVFQPFTQGSHARESRAYGGLGLGLAIVEDWTARHGGRVTASSPGRGQGASFAVYLPLQTVGAEPGAETPAAPPSAGEPAPQRVLLVEDHGPTRAALERMLRRRGHEVVAVGTKADAIAAGQVAEFDLLISDIGLPDGDGTELLPEIRRRHPHMRAIALSGFGMDADLRRSTEVGFALHLVKPVSMAKLDAAIARVPAAGALRP